MTIKKDKDMTIKIIKRRIGLAKTLLKDIRRHDPDDTTRINYYEGFLDALRGVQDEIQKHSSNG